MSTNAKPVKVAIIGASGTYGKGILARAEEIGIEAVVVTRSPHKFKEVKPTTTVVNAQLDEEEKLKEAFAGCDGVISALGDDRKKRPKTHNLPHIWNAMKAAGVTKYVGMGSGPMMMPGEKRGGFQRTVHPLLSVLKLFGVDMLEQNEWERDSLLMGKNGADGITWVLTRPVRPDQLLDLRPRRLLLVLRGVEGVGQACAACQLRADSLTSCCQPTGFNWPVSTALILVSGTPFG